MTSGPLGRKNLTSGNLLRMSSWSSIALPTTRLFCGRPFFQFIIQYQIQNIYSEADYPPQLVNEGYRKAIWEANRTIRSLNAKLGLQSPNVHFYISLRIIVHFLHMFYSQGKFLQRPWMASLCPRLDHGQRTTSICPKMALFLMRGLLWTISSVQNYNKQYFRTIKHNNTRSSSG